MRVAKWKYLIKIKLPDHDYRNIKTAGQVLLDITTHHHSTAFLFTPVSKEAGRGLPANGRPAGNRGNAVEGQSW